MCVFAQRVVGLKFLALLFMMVETLVYGQQHSIYIKKAAGKMHLIKIRFFNKKYIFRIPYIYSRRDVWLNWMHYTFTNTH